MALMLWRNFCSNALRKLSGISSASPSSLSHSDKHKKSVDHHHHNEEDIEYDLYTQVWNHCQEKNFSSYFTKEFEEMVSAPDYNHAEHVAEIMDNFYPRPTFYIDDQKGKIFTDEVEVSNDLGGSKGLHRVHLLLELQGVRDVEYDDGRENYHRRGTFEEPTRVASVYDEALVACECPHVMRTTRIMNRVHKGIKHRCYCGYWFELVDYDTVIFG